MLSPALSAALDYISSGLSIIPIVPDGTKKPACAWKTYQTVRASEDQAQEWFSSGKNGIAVIAGAVSGHLEVLDFERGSPFSEWLAIVQKVDPSLAECLPIVATPSGGQHVYYRCSAGVQGNLKLAMRLDGKTQKVVIETRGEGGYVLAPGSPATCHLTGKPYRTIARDLAEIPTITASERDLLLSAARSFNQATKTLEEPKGTNAAARPGDRYNAETTWHEILTPRGWKAIGQSGEETFWRRPGKEDGGWSATSNYRGSGLLYVFSTNCGDLQPDTSYSKFAVLAILDHGGDFRATTRYLADRYKMPPMPRQQPQTFFPQPGEEVKEAISDLPYIEFASSFLAVEDPPLKYLVAELLPEAILALAHGEPRTKKSWFAIDLGISLASGRPAFGLERFAVGELLPVLYSSQEDSARAVRSRIKRLLLGYNLPYPERMAFSVHKGIDLGEQKWQSRLLTDIDKHGFKLLILDPIRRYAADVDKGPNEVQKLTKFLREITVKTGCTVIINHHDVKPPGNGHQDTRRRSQKASGGDWFAACECPISIEKLGDIGSLVSPEDYKFSEDPKPFTFTIQEDETKTWARLIGEDSTSSDATTTLHDAKIVEYLQDKEGASTEAIRKHLKTRWDEVKNALGRLNDMDVVDFIGTGKNGSAKKWFLRGSKE